MLRDIGKGIRAGDPAVFEAVDRGAVDGPLIVVNEWRRAHANPLVKVNAGLRYYVRKAGIDDATVSQRLKRLGTIVDKLARQPGMELSRMEDIGGVRVILPRQKSVDEVVQSIQNARNWTVRRVRQYVLGRDPGPKADGYRAVHLVVVKDGHFVEIQFRTPYQDVWAQSVEQDTRRLRAGLKFGDGPTELREYYALVSEVFALREIGLEPPRDLMEALAKLYSETRQYFIEQPDAGR